MARKGDIDSKSVASRVPMEVYLRLLKSSSSKGLTLSAYLCDVLSEGNFSQGGQTKIEFKEKVVYRDVPKIEYRDRIVEKIVEKRVENPKNPKLLLEIEKLEKQVFDLTTHLFFPKPKRADESPAIKSAREDIRRGTASVRVREMIQELDANWEGEIKDWEEKIKEKIKAWDGKL